jgi:hypothetical protein
MVGAGEGDRVGGSVAGVAGGQQFVDRSKVRILLCDGDSNSSSEVLQLLCNCSYQGLHNFTAPPYLVCFSSWDYLIRMAFVCSCGLNQFRSTGVCTVMILVTFFFVF